MGVGGVGECCWCTGELASRVLWLRGEKLTMHCFDLSGTTYTIELRTVGAGFWPLWRNDFRIASVYTVGILWWWFDMSLLGFLFSFLFAFCFLRSAALYLLAAYTAPPREDFNEEKKKGG
eukprot:TRINITY_DN28220_c0_g1_i1.p1 TRINITY_DN28220_c0_g1~~TRINITY_DN28220_c0_g1_i1.p1  ORF type:complete len:120 (+),score=16.29 TRINITY_DN28220_c0_g1_i1:107-466(+)